MPIKFFLLPFACLIRNFKKEKIEYLIVDGFLVGDVVMSRAFCKSILLQSKKVAYLGNAQSKLILEDLPMHRIEYKWPWASYDYSFVNLLKLFQTLWKIFLLQPEFIFELRGDFRSLFCLYFTCSKLIGFNFSNGKKFLHREIITSDDLHQEEYYRLISRELGFTYDEKWIHRKPMKRESQKKRIGISFSGSQVLKVLPASMGFKILEFLADKNIELVYFDFTNEPFLRSLEIDFPKINMHRLQTFAFESYFSEIQNIDSYIGMDSAGGHLASMFQIPSLIFYGTNESDFFYPKGNPKLIRLELQEKLSCRPCDGINCTNETFQKCLVDISFERIENAISRLLSY